MRHTIDTAPRNRKVIIIEDGTSGSNDIAHWSPESGQWIGKSGTPSKIAPTHWHPVPLDNPIRDGQSDPVDQDHAALGLLLGDPSDAWKSAINVFPRAVVSGPSQVGRVGRSVVACSTAVILVTAAAIGLYFHFEAAAPGARYAHLQEIYRMGVIGVDRATEWLRRVPVRAYLRAPQQQAASDQDGGTFRQALDTQTPEARRSVEHGAPEESLTKYPAEAPEVLDANNAQLRSEIDQEHQRTAALMQDVDVARQALTSNTAQYHHALEEEHTRSVALASELAAARRELDTTGALSSKANDEAAQLREAAEAKMAELQQERDHSAALTSELATARRDLQTKLALSSKVNDEAAQLREAAEAEAAELKQSLQQERDHSAALTSELATARRDFETKVALSSKPSDEAAQLREAAEAEAAELKQSLQQERDHSAVLTGELATARRDIETKVASSSKANDEAAQLRKAAEVEATELKQSLQQERDHSTVLTSELATARRDIETKVALSSKANDEAAQLRKAAEAKAAELGKSLQREREKAVAMARDLESAQHVIETRMTPDRTANGQIGQTQVGQTKPAAVSAAAKPPAAAEIKDNLEVARLMARASTLLAQGNIGAARTVLDRAVEAGSPDASFALAETYDPHVLSRWGTYGTRGDASRARELYAKAMVGGIQEAKDRFNALRQ